MWMLFIYSHYQHVKPVEFLLQRFISEVMIMHFQLPSMSVRTVCLFSGSSWRKGLLPVGLQLRGTDYISGHQGTGTHIPHVVRFNCNQRGRHSSDNVYSFSNIAVCSHHDSQGLEGGTSGAVWARYVNAAACKAESVLI